MQIISWFRNLGHKESLGEEKRVELDNAIQLVERVTTVKDSLIGESVKNACFIILDYKAHLGFWQFRKIHKKIKSIRANFFQRQKEMNIADLLEKIKDYRFTSNAPIDFDIAFLCRAVALTNGHLKHLDLKTQCKYASLQGKIEFFNKFKGLRATDQALIIHVVETCFNHDINQAIERMGTGLIRLTQKPQEIDLKIVPVLEELLSKYDVYKPLDPQQMRVVAYLNHAARRGHVSQETEKKLLVIASMSVILSRDATEEEKLMTAINYVNSIPTFGRNEVLDKFANQTLLLKNRDESNEVVEEALCTLYGCHKDMPLLWRVKDTLMSGISMFYEKRVAAALLYTRLPLELRRDLPLRNVVVDILVKEYERSQNGEMLEGLARLYGKEVTLLFFKKSKLIPLEELHLRITITPKRQYVISHAQEVAQSGDIALNQRCRQTLVQILEKARLGGLREEDAFAPVFKQTIEGLKALVKNDPSVTRKETDQIRQLAERKKIELNTPDWLIQFLAAFISTL